jgi:CheY-like chemotaxis protein
MTAETKRRGRGRPPAGVREDELVSEYPQLSLRVPADVQERLRALAAIGNRPQWRVLSDAVDAYVRHQPADIQQLVSRLLDRAAPLLAQPIRSRSRRTATASILNVDDNEAMLFARSSILRKEGYEVLEAQTGGGALAMLRRSRPDILLIDVNLPDMSGLEVGRIVRSTPAYSGVKIIQVSATYSTPHDQLHGLNAGAADIYLAEPVPRGTLLSVVRRLLLAS